MICSNYITITGFDCLYWKIKPTSDTIRKILKWKACKNTTNVKTFLGTAVQCWNYILNFIIVVACHIPSLTIYSNL